MDDDDQTGEQATPGSPRTRTVAVAAAVGVAGLVAGGIAAATLSSAAADAGADGATPGERGGYGVPRDGYDARPPVDQGQGRVGGDCPEGLDLGRGDGAPGDRQPPAPGDGQRPPPSTEDSSIRDS